MSICHYRVLDGSLERHRPALHSRQIEARILPVPYLGCDAPCERGLVHPMNGVAGDFTHYIRRSLVYQCHFRVSPYRITFKAVMTGWWNRTSLPAYQVTPVNPTSSAARVSVARPTAR